MYCTFIFENCFNFFILQVLDAQYSLPSEKECCGEDMCVNITGPCQVHKCPYNHPLLFCPEFMGPLCTCQNGYYFSACYGECRETCPSKNQETECVNKTNAKTRDYGHCVPKNCTRSDNCQ